jgi:hypothetical protein
MDDLLGLVELCTDNVLDDFSRELSPPLLSSMAYIMNVVDNKKHEATKVVCILC